MQRRVILYSLRAMVFIFLMVIGERGWGQLASWDPTGLSWGPSPFNPTTLNPNIEVTGLERGVGFGTSGTPAANTYGGSGANQTSSAAAITGNDYFLLTIKPKSGFQLSLSGIPTWFTRKSGSGTMSILVQYSFDQINYSDIGSISVTSTTGTGSSTPLSFSSTVQSALSNITDDKTVTFRFLVVSSTNANLYFAIGTGDRFSIDGAVAAVPSVVIPSLTTTPATNLTTSGAGSGGEITNDGGAAVTARGVAFGISFNPTSGTSDGNGTGAFTSTLFGLNPNTQYFYRAYATNSVGTGYGNEDDFFTLALTPGAPTVSNATINTVDVTIDANGNPAHTTFAIQEAGGNYVQADGTLGATAVWQTAVAWTPLTVFGLSANTSYLFQVKARNGDNVETALSIPGQGTTLAATSPMLSVNPNSLSFGDVCINTTTAPSSFTVTGSNLDGSNVMIAALAGYRYSTTAVGTYTSTLTIPGAGTISQEVFVRFTPTSVANYDGSLNINGGNAAPVAAGVAGNGVNTAPTVTAVAPTSTTSTSAGISGSIDDEGCSSVSAFGIEYSTSSGFVSGTQVQGGTLTGGSFSVNLTGLSANTSYYYKLFATNNGGTTYSTENNFTTLGLSAPIATAATDVIQNSFTANWNAVEGAESYRLDVGLTNEFSQPIQQKEGFENGFSIFTLVSGTGTFKSGSSGTSLYPNSSQLATEGTYSYGISGGSARLLSSNFNINGSSSFSFRLASFSGTSGNGADGGDSVTVSISPDGGTTWFHTLKVLGSSNARWNFDIAGTASAAFDGDSTPAEFIGTTASGVSTITVTNLPTSPNLLISISLKNNDASEHWIIDDFILNTYQNNFLPGYENLTVNGTSQSVTGLTPNTTYYYRVRANSTNSTSVNSNVINVTTVAADPTTAEYVSNGNVSTSSATNWQYNNGSALVDAPAPPAATNSVTINNGHTLTIDNHFEVGTGKTFTLFATSTVLVSPAASISIAGTANFNTQSVIFQSTAAGTARLGKVSGTLTGASNVTIQQYIPAKRAWRLMNAPLSNSNSIIDSWQNGAVYTPGRGTFITGPSGTGLDAAAGYSLKTYNVTSQALEDVTNTHIPVSAHPAYFFFIRGDRNQANLTPPNTNETILSVTGTLIIGDNSVTVAKKPDPATSRFTLVGNPYASQVHWTAITKTGVANRFYVWDPKLSGSNGVGGYVVFDSDAGFWPTTGGGSYTTGVANTRIESSQAFFVESNTDASNGTLTFTEAAKSAGNQNVFRTGNGTIEKLQVVLKVQQANQLFTPADGIFALYENSFSTAVTGEDAPKRNNLSENLSITRNGKLLSIEKRPLIESVDTIYLKLQNTSTRNYQFDFQPENFGSGLLAAYIEDGYTGISTPVSLNQPTVYPFAVTSDVASANPDRFRIVFKTAGVLPMKFVSIQATQQGVANKVSWQVASLEGSSSFEVERAADGIRFKSIGKVNAGGETTFSFIDASPSNGNNFYRVKAIEHTGNSSYSRVVNVKTGEAKSDMSIFPNPVTDKVFNVQFVQVPKGSYTVHVIKQNGQVVMERKIQHDGGSAGLTINLSAGIASGIYQLQVQDANLKMTRQIMLK